MRIANGFSDDSDDARKAAVIFEHARTVMRTGNFDYSIEMYIQGLNLDPDAVEAHQALREISLKRKATGGKSLGMFEAMKLKRPTKDDKQNLLNAEKLLAYDPSNREWMTDFVRLAWKGGFGRVAACMTKVMRDDSEQA